MTLFITDSQNVLGKSVKEEGTYNVRILSDSECKKTKDTNNDMAVFNYEVLDGPYKGGKILYNNVVWDPTDIELSAKRFNTITTAVGIPDGTPINSIQQLVNGLKGKSLNITVGWKQSDYNKRWNLSVKAHNKFDEEGSKSNGVKRPDYNHQAQNNQKSAPQQQSFPGVDPFNGITDDDLPF
ncbi:DUF669 domain-containing protein [Enterococcus sp. DIV1420a]|uniref:DUF669 domain-containing protein n=1 Tax=Enterococcus sp. DIV1420a TaxID=2774672 RepID=UPI003F259394